MCQHLEKLSIVYLWVPQDGPQRVRDGGFQSQQRLHGQFVDAFVAVSVKFRKILYLKFLNKILVDAADEQLPQDSTGIHVENLLLQLLLQKTVALLL